MPAKNYAIPSGTRSVVVLFMLYEIDSWDGNSTRYGPDYFQVQMSDPGGTTADAFNVTLGHLTDSDEVSGVTPTGNITYKVEDRPKGFLGFTERWADQKHKITIQIPAAFYSASNTLRLRFDFQTTTPTADEAGGVDDINIWACFPPAEDDEPG